MCPSLGYKQVLRSVVDGAIATAVNKFGYKATSHTKRRPSESRRFWERTCSSLCLLVVTNLFALPYVFDTLRARDDSIVVVVCPLQTIMEDQVVSIRARV